MVFTMTSTRRSTHTRPHAGILALLALLTAATVLSGCGSSTSAARTVDPVAFAQTAAQPGVTVVDVRTPAEFAAGHVAGAINIDVESADFATRIADLDTAGTYAVYCRSGRRSAIAADQLADAGFANVYNLDGGLTDLLAVGAPAATS